MRVVRLAVAAAGLAVTPPLRADVITVRPHLVPLQGLRRSPHWRGFGLRRFPGRRPYGPVGLPPRPPDLPGEPEVSRPSPSPRFAPGNLPAFAHGFHLSVTVGAGQTFTVPPTLDRFIEVGRALGACFAPPAAVTWTSVTLRVSFRRDGSVFGLPRIPYSDADPADRKSDLAHSLLDGLKRCTPLPLSRSLGAAVAGEIFAIRFIHQDKR